MHITATIIEQVTPKQVAGPARLDEWRWAGVAGFDEYREHVLRAEAERAARAHTAALYEPKSRGFA